jgi:glycosyltransferase involved in cell wall biosynthesis
VPTAGQVKVAHVTTVDLSLRLLLLNQLQSLREEGYSITGISASGPHIPVLHDRGIRHISVRMTRSVTPLTDLAALWRLYRIMRKERFTIVHCHTPKAELLGQLAARLAGVPIVVDTFRGIYDNVSVGPLRRAVFVAMSRLAAACADLVLCQSRDTLKAATRAKLCPPDRIVHLGNGVDVRRFDRRRLDQRDLQRARKELGIDPSRPVVGFVGRLVREKGILDLFAAMRLVVKRVPDAQLVVVGETDSDKPDAVRPELARHYGIEPSCVFAGLRTDMPTLYGLMDVFVLPSYRESFPRAPMEASAMGVPCVLTDIPGCREVVDHGHNGLLVRIGHPAGLARAIVTLLTHKDAARRMARLGRQKALTSFDEERVFGIVKAAYARLLSEKGIALPSVEQGRSSVAVFRNSVAGLTQP